MPTFNGSEYPHRRYNPLTGEWVLVSPHRLKRPWQGATEAPAAERLPSFDPDCYLCPGVERAGGERNPEYESTFVFRNDFAALLPDVPQDADDAGAVESPITTSDIDPLLRSRSVRGECRVICFSPRHDLTLARMSDGERLRVVQLWISQSEELNRTWRWLQIFENRGEAMGASNPHPHGQIWALDQLPTIAAREDEMQRSYLREHGGRLLLDYAHRELELAERVVAREGDWLAVVPYWAVWPFEVLLLPLFAVDRLELLDTGQQMSLARLMGRLLVRYDNLFETSFPYSMGWHGAPGGPVAKDDSDAGHWQLHAHLYPPLLRSATVRKFMVGFEMLGEPQRDLTAEQAAQRLAGLPDRHYLERREA